jgi:hypothetical protein
MFNIRVNEEERNSIDGKLESIDSRLNTSVEKTKATFQLRTIAPKKHNFFIQDNVESFREGQIEVHERRHVDHSKKHNELKFKIEKKRKDAERAIAELKQE